MLDKEKIKLLWDWRHHQDNLIHTRVGWTIATQSFLLIAFANSADKQNALVNDVAIIIPWIGIVSTAVMMISVITGISTYHKIRKELRSEKYSEPPTLERGTANITWLGFLPTFVIPVIFIVLWFYVLIHG